MMPDLGKYAEAVLSAYGVSLLLLAGLVAVSLWRGARARRQLRAVEGRMTARRFAAERPETGQAAPDRAEARKEEVHG